MSGRDDLRAAMRAIMAAKRDGLGEPPTPEELLDYREGRLDEAARREVEEKLAAFPDAARTLADLAAFPEVEPTKGVVEPSDEEVSARWRSFRDRLESAEIEAAEVADIRDWRQPQPGTAWWQLAAAGVLAFAVGLTTGLVTGPKEGQAPAEARLNVSISQLAPEGSGLERSGERRVVEVPESAQAWVLVLEFVDPIGGGAEAEYSAAIADARGEEVWSAAGLHTTPAGTFHLAFDRGFLPSGEYVLRLSRDLEDGAAEVAVYEFRLLRE